VTERAYIVAYLLAVWPVAQLLVSFPLEADQDTRQAECLVKQAERGEVVDPLKCIEQSLTQ
jgi:hypothetical protein